MDYYWAYKINNHVSDKRFSFGESSNKSTLEPLKLELEEEDMDRYQVLQ